MRVRLLSTQGNGKFVEHAWDKPTPSDNEIEVKAVMTGVCRSDIDMMQGQFRALPLEMQGHEGLGIVTKVGSQINDVKIGDFVATRGEPAYADFYNSRVNEFVVVPELAPKYILEPVACGVNCVDQGLKNIGLDYEGKCLILGTGFLAWVAYHTLVKDFKNLKIDVVGSSNQEIWNSRSTTSTRASYDIVIDLSGKYQLGIDINLNNNCRIVDAVGKAVSKKEAQEQLWKACTTVRPSPRTPSFIDSMTKASHMIKNGELDVDYFWSKGYNRSTEWQQAFTDAADRPNDYSRGYIKWD
jgi:Alcohol dehydrogenase GroES-like domain